MGVYYVNRFQVQAAIPYVEKAYELRDRVSERERLYITEKYYAYITGETDKVIETLQTWARLYPDDFIPHNNLSLNFKLLGRYDEALKEGLEAVRLSPNNVAAYDNLVSSFIGLGRFDEAEQAEREAQKINSDGFDAHKNNYFFAYLRKDQATMDREAQWMTGKPEEAEFLSMLSATALSQGKFKEAEELSKRSLEMLKRQNRPENAATNLMGLSGSLVMIGKCDQAKDNAKAAMNLVRGYMTLSSAALTYAACGDTSQARSLLDEVRSAYPQNMLVAAIVSPIVEAEIQKHEGNVAKAIQLIESAAEFQAIIDHPGVDAFSPCHTLAHLGLARAASISGDTAAARKSYQDFLALWKDADQDLPVLVQAKKEYEQLKS
jgi:tetratricopeptide (TPR) repeat protein